MINFKLKFHTSQTTQLDNKVIVDRIVKMLNDKKYEVLEIKNNSVTFGRPFFELVWRHKAPYILDGGNFTIIKSETEIIVVLDYFIKTLYLFLFTTVSLVYPIIVGFYEALWFFSAFFLATGVHQFFATKNTGKKLLNDMLTGEY